jgi:TetR/AcrR family transcriptional repressor of nem operon
MVKHTERPAFPEAASMPVRRRGRPPNPGRREDTRALLVRCGTELCTERGFQITGIDEVLKRAGVPKGSFYHFFRSKHEFGEAVIENYRQYYEKRLDRFLKDTSMPPLERLDAFINEAQLRFALSNFRRGCLVGNLGQELGGMNDNFRAQLAAVLNDWEARVAACLQEAIERGDLPASHDAAMLASLFWNGWQGAVWRAKLEQSAAPIRSFGAFFFRSIGRKEMPAEYAEQPAA